MLPKPIYEIAPFAYAGFGLVSLLAAQNTVGFMSSVTLIVVALFIIKLRNDSRFSYWGRP